jgi:glycosyltransferase involved in cell wall biosynthesis
MLARHDLDIDLIVPRPDKEFRDGAAEWRGAIRRFYGSEEELLPDNVRLVDVWRPASARGDLRRAFHDVLAPFRLRSGQYDLAYTRDLYALSLMLVLGVPSIFETYRTDINVLRRFAAFRRLAHTHPQLLGVVTHSRLASDLFERMGVEGDRLLVAHNGYAPDVMLPVRSRQDARHALGVSAEDRIVCYAGHVNPKKGVDVLIPIAQRVPTATFLVVGAIPGSESEREFGRLVAEAGVTNLRVLPRVPPGQVADYLYAADCLIIPPTAGPLERFHRTVLPMKTYLYLAAGRAIVGPDLPDVREILTDGVNAALVQPDDVVQCARTIERLLASREESERLGARARFDAGRYTWQERGRRIAEFVKKRWGETRGLAG